MGAGPVPSSANPCRSSWAGKEFEIDAFLARQSFLAGRRDEDVLLDKVRTGYFDVIQLGSWDSDREDERMSPAFVQTLRRCYRIDHVSANGAFFTLGPDSCDRSASADANPTNRATGSLGLRQQSPARDSEPGVRPVVRGQGHMLVLAGGGLRLHPYLYWSHFLVVLGFQLAAALLLAG